MTKTAIVKLADFGVATKLSEDEKSYTFVGTPYWFDFFYLFKDGAGNNRDERPEFY